MFIYASNRVEFGHLIHADGFETSHLHNDLWAMATNRYDWEKRYTQYTLRCLIKIHYYSKLLKRLSAAVRTVV